MPTQATAAAMVVEFSWYLGLIWSTERGPPMRREVVRVLQVNRQARHMRESRGGTIDVVADEWIQRNTRAETTGPALLMEGAIAIFWKEIRPRPLLHQLEHELLDNDANRAVIHSMIRYTNALATVIISPLLIGPRWFDIPDYTLRARFLDPDPFSRTPSPATERASSSTVNTMRDIEDDQDASISPSFVDEWGYTIPAQYREGPASPPGLNITTNFQLAHTSPWRAAECFILGATGVTMDDIHTVKWSAVSQQGLRIRFHRMAALIAVSNWVMEINSWGGYEINATRLVDCYLYFP